jgi:hypothetical protein
MTPAFKVHLKKTHKSFKNQLLCCIHSTYNMFHNGMGVINHVNCTPEYFKCESLCRQSSTPGLDIKSYLALLAHPRRVINSSPAFFKHEGLVSTCQSFPQAVGESPKILARPKK